MEQALRRFNREVQRSGILDEVKDRSHYRKPSELKRQKSKELERKFKFEKLRG
ncbi:MAG: 30S ribosomal protein S21 [candidate division WWE3 bacterium GW2011_GWF2_41_45]|nr:MAG: 30S ribosomal protein S21 [candidate division WWE3 bacterium GW2011_GWF2_41_45]KKS28238.1 MAG: 30S ribosomal protein S21 [candidate division WWE3 bacterium GW2011_GWC1_42_102]